MSHLYCHRGACEDLGCLKLANHIYGLGLVFKPEKPEGNIIKYKDFINDKDLRFLGRDKLVDSIINYSRNKSDKIADKPTILRRLDETSKKGYDSYQLLNGHDICNAVLIFVKYVLKIKNPALLDCNSIEAFLSLAFDFVFFTKTNLYTQIITWAMAQPTPILKPCFR